MTFPTINAAINRKLADLLKACPIEGMVTYEQLSRELGAPISDRLYLVHRAMELANAESGAIFINVKLVGYKRLAHDDAHAVGAQARVRSRRIFNRASKKISNVLIVANDMSNAARIKAYSEQAALGLLQHLTYDRNRPVIREDSQPPPTQEIIRAGIEALRAARAQRLGG